jgi:hypothetical protein
MLANANNSRPLWTDYCNAYGVILEDFYYREKGFFQQSTVASYGRYVPNSHMPATLPPVPADRTALPHTTLLVVFRQ